MKYYTFTSIRRLPLVLWLLCGTGILLTYGQNSVGIGTEEPNPRAVLHLVSPTNSQGLLIPSMSTDQRTSEAFVASLSSSENGLLVYDSDDDTFYHWVDERWIPLVGGAIGGDLTGPLANLQINEGVVTLDNMADSSVASPTIVDNSITTDDLQSPGANKVLISTNAGTVFWENLSLFETVSLSQGFVYVGSTTNEPLEVDMRGSGNVLVGNGTTATSVTIGGDISLSSNGMAELTDESILNEDISPSASIEVAKLQNIPTGNVIYGNGEGVATVGLLSGDATINETGQVLLTNSPETRNRLGLDQSNVNITGGSISGASLAGDGSGITDVAAANLTGTLAVARLPNVPGGAQVYGDGSQPISSVTVDAKGRVTAATVGVSSDRRLKKDWVALAHSADRIREITPYKYYWKDGNTDRPQLGVMAQDVEKVFPELVNVRSDGYKTVNYTGLIPPMLNVIQEQQQTIDTLQKRLAQQDEENNAIQKELAEIRRLLARAKR